jgi:hypothetical protein
MMECAALSSYLVRQPGKTFPVNNNYFRIAREFQEGRVTRYNASIS